MRQQEKERKTTCSSTERFLNVKKKKKQKVEMDVDYDW